MDLQRIRAKIREMAASPKNVRFDEVENLLDKHIGRAFPITATTIKVRITHLPLTGKHSLSRSRTLGG